MTELADFSLITANGSSSSPLTFLHEFKAKGRQVLRVTATPRTLRLLAASGRSAERFIVLKRAILRGGRRKNPIEQEGTYPLPEAQLRPLFFFFKLLVKLLRCRQGKWLPSSIARPGGEMAPNRTRVIDGDQIRALQAVGSRSGWSLPPFKDYAVRLVAGLTSAKGGVRPRPTRINTFAAEPAPVEARQSCWPPKCGPLARGAVL